MAMFNSLQALALHLSTVSISAYKHQMHVALKEIGEQVEHQAHEEIGVYQPAVGPFAAWAPLADSTLEKKQRMNWGKGGNANTPLYATGQFDESIGHDVMPGKLAVEIGTNEPYVAVLEYGSATHNLPPRAVFGPAALVVLPKFLPKIQHLAATGLNTGGGFGVVLKP